jgi:hypothetical protein
LQGKEHLPKANPVVAKVFNWLFGAPVVDIVMIVQPA